MVSVLDSHLSSPGLHQWPGLLSYVLGQDTLLVNSLVNARVKNNLIHSLFKTLFIAFTAKVGTVSTITSCSINMLMCHSRKYSYHSKKSIF